MKINVNSVTTGFGFAALFFAISCGMNGKSITGSGNVITQSRNVTAQFDRIDSKNGIDVVIVQSENPGITVEADDNVIEHIHTEISGNTLKINSDFNEYNNVTSKKVTIKMINLEGIDASGGTHITTEGSIKGEKLKINASSGSDLELQLEVEDISCEASSGSQVKLSGKALKLETSTSSGSKIDCLELLANEVEANASSGSTIRVHPILRLNAEASSGGSIKFSGDPKEIKKDESSGGSVSAN